MWGPNPYSLLWGSGHPACCPLQHPPPAGSLLAPLRENEFRQVGEPTGWWGRGGGGVSGHQGSSKGSRDERVFMKGSVGRRSSLLQKLGFHAWSGMVKGGWGVPVSNSYLDQKWGSLTSSHSFGNSDTGLGEAPGWGHRMGLCMVVTARPDPGSSSISGSLLGLQRSPAPGLSRRGLKWAGRPSSPCE